MGTTVAPNAVAAVSEARQWDRLMEMAQLGAIAGRCPASTAMPDRARSRGPPSADRLGEEIGATVSVDAPAICGCGMRAPIRAPRPCVTGSHMDTQPNGGRFDGI